MNKRPILRKGANIAIWLGCVFFTWSFWVAFLFPYSSYPVIAVDIFYFASVGLGLSLSGFLIRIALLPSK